MQYWRFAVAILFLHAAGLRAATVPISFTSPRGGEMYVIGQSQKVIVSSKFKVVVVELSRDGGANFSALGTIDNRAIIDKSKLNQLAWTVAGPASNRAQIRVTGKNSLTDNRKSVTITSGDFSISDSASGIPGGAVTDFELADGAVTTPKLANNAVTTAKIGSGAASPGFFLSTDGQGGALWSNTISGSLTVAGTLDAKSGITFPDGTTQTTAASGSSTVPDVLFPDGATTQRKLITINPTGYAVPDGKTLYVFYFNQTLAVFLNAVKYGTCVSGEVLATPLAVPGGVTLTTDGTDPIAVCMECDAIVATKVFPSFQSYSIPAGKTLLLRTAYIETANNDSDIILINGTDLLSFTRIGTNSPKGPFVIPGGNTISLKNRTFPVNITVTEY